MDATTSSCTHAFSMEETSGHYVPANGRNHKSKIELVQDFVRAVSYEPNPPDILLPKVNPQHFLDDIKDFEVREDDIFLISYPKSGTTWIQRILLLILADGDTEAMKTHIFEAVPFLENAQAPFLKKLFSDQTLANDMKGMSTLRGMYEIAAKMESPRVMKTHLPIQFLPRQIKEKKPKIVYVARNPRDTAVSFFHFCRVVRGLPSYPTWSDFFEDFVKGLAPRGEWFDNVIYWWNNRHEPNILFITYEELKRDLREIVARLCNFLGKNLSDDIIDDITRHSSFDAMRNDPKLNPDTLPFYQDARKEGVSFFRKGKVGDWKNYFTVEQNERFEAIYGEKMRVFGTTFDQ